MTLTRSQQMARIRGADTTPERALRSALWSTGVRGYRVNARTPGGRADVAFGRARVAVFLDGCFWHGCPEHYVRPRTREPFWSAKLRDNVERDRRQTRVLEAAGWTIVRAWEHEVFEAVETVVARVRAALEGRAEARLPAWRVVRVEVVDPLRDLERRTMEDLREPSQTLDEVRVRTTHKWKKRGGV